MKKQESEDEKVFSPRPGCDVVTSKRKRRARQRMEDMGLNNESDRVH